MKVIFWVVFIFLIVEGCISNTNRNAKQLNGNWQAIWELKDPSLYDAYSTEQLKMYGHITFHEGNEISITAFGFEGCVFSSDTATNELFYNLQDSLINIINSEEDIIFSYLIKELNEKEVSMILLNDIQLTLLR